MRQKSIVYLAQCVVLSAFVLSGCQNSLTDLFNTEPSSGSAPGGGTVRVDFSPSSSYERTLMPQSFPSITKYNVYLQPVGPGVSQSSLNLASPDLALFSNVTAGDWKIVLEGYDSLNGFIAGGETSFALASGESATVSVSLTPPSIGSGSFSAVFMFPDEGLNVESVSFILRLWPSGTEVPNVNYTISRNSGEKTVTIFSAPLACGQYLLEVNYALSTVNGLVQQALPPHVIHIYNTLASVPKDGQPIVYDTLSLTKAHATYFVGGSGTGSGRNPSSPCAFEYALLQLIEKSNFLTLDRPGVIMLVDSQASWSPAGSTQIDIPVRVTSLNEMSPSVLRIEPVGSNSSALLIGNASTLVSGSKAKMMFDHVTVRPMSPAELPSGSGTLFTLTNGVLELGQNAVFDGYFGVATGGSIVRVTGGGLFRMLPGSTISGSQSIAGGGAVYLDSIPSNDSIFARAEIAGTITGCMTSGNGGAILADAGFIELKDGALISSNEAYSGGGLYIGSSGKLVVTGGQIVGNSIAIGSSGKGGGIYAASLIECNGAMLSIPFIKQNSSGGSGEGGGLWTDYTGGKPIQRDGAEPDYINFLSFFGMDADVNSGESYATSNMCSVEYDMHGGTPILSADYVRAGTILTAPVEPVKTESTFSDWYQDTMYTMIWYFADPVTYDLQLHAKWISSDTEIPSVSVFTLPPYTNQNAITITGTASDIGVSGVNRVEYSLDGGSTWAMASGTSTWSFTGEGLTNGVNTFLIRAVDNANNESTNQEVSITVDLTIPVVSIMSPANNANVNEYFEIMGTAADDVGLSVVEYSTNGGASWSPATGLGNWTASIDTMMLPDGGLTVSVRAVDYAGNIHSVQLMVIVDKLDPNVVITNPANNAYVADIFTLLGTVSEPVAFMTYSIDSGPENTIPNNSSWSAEVNVSALMEGAHTIAVQATDFAGNLSSGTVITLYVDRTTPNVMITNPAQDSYVSGTFTMSGTVSEQVASMQYRIDGGSQISISPATSWSTVIDQASLSEAPHTITVTATDFAGNISSTASVTITADYTTPFVQITTPVIGFYVKDPFTMSGTSSEPLALLQYSIDGGIPVNITESSSWTTTIDTIPIAEGSRTIVVTGTDFAGRAGTSSITIFVDKTMPIIQSQYPSPDMFINNPVVTMQATVIDNTGPVASVTFYLDSIPYPVMNGMNDSPFTASWLSPDLSEGIHTMRIEVVDKAGNIMNIGEYTFTIDTTAPTVMINLPEEGFTYPMGIVNCSGTFSEVCSSVSGTVVPNPVEGDYTPGSVSLTNWNYPTSPLSTGTYTLSVKAVDLAGNMSVPVTRMFLVE